MNEADDAMRALYCASAAEQVRLTQLPDEPRTLLHQQIKLLALRERRIMRAMAALRRMYHMTAEALEEHAQKDARTFGKAAADSEQTYSEHAMRRRSAFDACQELDAQLNRLNEQKLKAIELLARLDERQDAQKPGVSFSICIPDNGRARIGTDAAPGLVGLGRQDAAGDQTDMDSAETELAPELAVR